MKFPGLVIAILFYSISAWGDPDEFWSTLEDRQSFPSCSDLLRGESYRTMYSDGHLQDLAPDLRSMIMGFQASLTQLNNLEATLPSLAMVSSHEVIEGGKQLLEQVADEIARVHSAMASIHIRLEMHAKAQAPSHKGLTSKHQQLLHVQLLLSSLSENLTQMRARLFMGLGGPSPSVH